MTDLTARLLNTGLISGHFVLASGRHANEKFDFDLIAAKPGFLAEVTEALASLIHSSFPLINTLITVANGANVLAEPVAKHLWQKHGIRVCPLTTTKASDGAFDLNAHHRTALGNFIVLDDVFTKGTNVHKVLNAASRYPGKPLGVIVVLNRNRQLLTAIDHDSYQLPIISILQRPMLDVSAEECCCQQQSWPA